MIYKIPAIYLVMIACCWLFIETSPGYVKTKRFDAEKLPLYIEALQESDSHRSFVIIEHPPSKFKLWFHIFDDTLEAYFLMLSESDKTREDHLRSVSVQDDLEIREKNEGDYTLYWDFTGSPEMISQKTEILLKKGFNLSDFSELKITTKDIAIKK